MGKAISIAALAIGLVAVLSAAVALADKGNDGKEPSKISLFNPGTGVYGGAVDSDDEACERKRTVKVFHDQNRNGIDKTDYEIGDDRTDREGEYEVVGNQAPAGDKIVARVEKRKLKDGTVCLPKDRSAIAGGGIIAN
jgi:hypothetical protein